MQNRLVLDNRIVVVIVCALVGWNVLLPLMVPGLVGGGAAEVEAGHSDFRAAYRAGQAFAGGANPYLAGSGAEAFTAPPTLLPLYGLLGQLPEGGARALWLLASLGSYALAFGLLLRRTAAHFRLALVGLGVGLTLLSHPLLLHLREAQADLAAASLVFLGFLAMRRRRLWVSAGLLALATALTPGAVFLLLTVAIFARDPRAVGRYLLCVIGLVGLSLLLVPLGLYGEYAREIAPALSGGGPFNQSLGRYLQGSSLPLALAGLLLGAPLAWVLGMRTRLVCRQMASDQALMISAFLLMNVLLMLLCVGTSWPSAFVWVLLPLMQLLPLLARSVRGKFMAGVAGVVLLLLARVLPLPGLATLNMVGALLTAGALLLPFAIPRRIFVGKH